MAPPLPHQEADTNKIIRKLQQPGEDYYIFKPTGLNIVWGRDSRYWNVDDDKAELSQVSWLEVSGDVRVKPGSTYTVGFEVSLKADAFGWVGTPVYLMAKVGRKGRYTRVKVDLSRFFNGMGYNQAIFKIPADDESRLSVYVPRSADDDDSTIYFGLYEMWSGKWKGGLQIYSAYIRKQRLM